MNRTAACALAIGMMWFLDTAGAQTTRSAPPQRPTVVEKPSPSVTPTLPSPSLSAPSSPAAVGPADVDNKIFRDGSSLPRADAPFAGDQPAPAAGASPAEEAPSYSDLCQATPRPPWCSR
jgi:hypothetical protein